MKEEWLMPGAVVPVDVETTAALVAEIKRLIGVVGDMALNMQPAQEPVAWINWCAATGKRSVSFECESELASQPLYEGITQNTQDHYSNFHSWFYSSPHRAKYSTDHPAYLAAQEAWEASSDLKKYNYTNGYCTGRTDLLAEQKAEQPVAWMWRCKPYCGWPEWSVSLKRPADSGRDGHKRTEGYEDVPLYTSPQSRQWVDLTEAEIDEICLGDEAKVRTALQLLKEKNYANGNS